VPRPSGWRNCLCDPFCRTSAKPNPCRRATTSRGFSAGTDVDSRDPNRLDRDELGFELGFAILEEHAHHFMEVDLQLVERFALAVRTRPAGHVADEKARAGVAFDHDVEGPHVQRINPWVLFPATAESATGEPEPRLAQEVARKRRPLGSNLADCGGGIGNAAPETHQRRGCRQAGSNPAPKWKRPQAIAAAAFTWLRGPATIGTCSCAGRRPERPCDRVDRRQGHRRGRSRARVARGESHGGGLSERNSRHDRSHPATSLRSHKPDVDMTARWCSCPSSCIHCISAAASLGPRPCSSGAIIPQII
jgi:hypothetical protein